MSSLSQWLDTNAEALTKIAASNDLDVRLVRMMATFVLANMDDEQIDAQLFGHGFTINGDPKRYTHLSAAFKAIRKLAATGSRPTPS